jgi:Uma2 family endonuclease
MSTLPKTHLTPEEYLEIERKAEFKSEYLNGEMFAMAGVQEAHILIVTNIVISLGQQFRLGPCRVYSNDMRVCVSKVGLYTYPDVVAVCGDRQFFDDTPDTLLNPNLIVEVLSPSREAYDCTRKFEFYRAIDSLREYLVVSSDRIHAELFTRESDGKWTLTEANKMEDVFELPSVSAVLKLSDIYDKVEF